MSQIKQALEPSEPPPSYEKAAAPQAGLSSKPPLRGPLPLELPVLVSLRGKRVILASASPRRKQLLSQIGLGNVEINPSTVPENFPKSLSPLEYVHKTAQQKATTVYAAELDHPSKPDPALVIAADTIVISSAGRIVEKPRSEGQHIAMLKNLRDRGPHKVFTAVVVMAPLDSLREPGYAMESTVEETTVVFDRDVTDAMILAYVKTREGADKAGGYGLQGMGALLVEKIDGSWDNVVGLPLRATLQLIEKVCNQEAEAEADDEEGMAFDDEEVYN